MGHADDILAHEIDEAVRRIALTHIEAAEDGRKRLASNADDEALHDFRVSVRRLRSHLRAYRRHLDGVVVAKHRKELKRIQRATGAARDAEVWVEWLRSIRSELTSAGVEANDRLIARFERERREASAGAAHEPLEAFKRVAKKLDRRLDAFTRSVRTRFDSPTYGAVLAGLSRIHASELAAMLEELRECGGEDADLAHSTRIAGKRLRYLIEPAKEASSTAAEIIKDLKQLQDLLGDLHDLHELIARIDDLLDRGKPTDAARRGLSEIRARAEQGAARLTARLLADWLADGGARLVRKVDAFAGEAEGSSELEIERKFLLRALPERAVGAPAKKLDQGYVPGERLHERVRRVGESGGERFFRTVKLGRGVSRIEIEDETSRDIFEALWALTEGRRVSKLRYIVEEGGLKWEIDAFLDRELFLAEVELPDAKIEPKLPAWLAEVVVREVTDEDTYVNLNLAK